MPILLIGCVTNHPTSIGELNVNLRQMENRITGKRNWNTGFGIHLCCATRNVIKKMKVKSIRAEQMLQRIQDLPPDGSVDTDLRVIYWKNSDDLLDKLVNRIINDMEEDTGQKYDPEAAYKLWLEAVRGSDKNSRPDYHQIISPYRHEDFGIEAINLRLQQEARGIGMQRVGQLAGNYIV